MPASIVLFPLYIEKTMWCCTKDTLESLVGYRLQIIYIDHDRLFHPDATRKVIKSIGARY